MPPQKFKYQRKVMNKTLTLLDLNM